MQKVKQIVTEPPKFVEYIPWILSLIAGTLWLVRDKEFHRLLREIAVRVKALRVTRGLSQEELAFEADIDRTYVSQIERSLINPSLFVLHKVANALGVTVSALLPAAVSDEQLPTDSPSA